MANGTAYATKEELLDAITALVFYNDSNLTDSDAIQEAIKDVVESLWNSGFPTGGENFTLRFNDVGVLVVDIHTSQDGNGNNTISKSLVIGASATPAHIGLNVGGTGLVNTGEDNILGGDNNNVDGDLNIQGGFGNQNAGNSNIGAGTNNQLSAASVNNSTVGYGNQLVGNCASNNVSGTEHVLDDGTINSVITGYRCKIHGKANNNISGAFNESSVNDVTMSGYKGKALNPGRVLASSVYALGSNQMEELVLQALTNGTTVQMRNATDANFFLLSDNSVYKIDADIVGVQYGGISGTIGDSTSFKIKATVKIVAGTLTILGSPAMSDIQADTGAASWSAAINSSGNSITFSATAETNKQVIWTAYVKAIKAGF